MTTDEIMRLAEALADTTSECDRAGAAVECICLPANTALRATVDTLVAERDALRTERDALRQVIEQQLLTVPVGEWKK